MRKVEVISVNLGRRSYPIHIGERVSRIGKVIKELGLGKKILVITNNKVFHYYGETIKRDLEKRGYSVNIVKVPIGEKYKSINQAIGLYEKCVNCKLERNSTILALGGGVINDLAGFVAATYLRGINFIAVPTTLLAQVDASIGGKVGVDLPQAKNLVGSFYQPRAVLIDPEVLKTLPSREMRTGMSEIVKYGIIRDKSLFEYLEKNLERIKKLETNALQRVIVESVRIKAKIVSQDEREEKGEREILNFGHTIGHSIEAAEGYQGCRHGEAISIGMLKATEIAVAMHFCSPRLLLRMGELLKRMRLPTKPLIKSGVDEGKIYKSLFLDKKKKGGKLRFILPRRLGDVFICENVPFHLIRKVLQGGDK
ncbi:MAG: 3-dehydroquinate synthase [Candidatus Omnitrophica bacterium]|nr:3-dehydroquinate synthase [Candidatus Omnitrophota bacterium]